MIFKGISRALGAIGNVVRAPFQIAGGLLQSAVGVATLPFRALGSLFGFGSPAAHQGAQQGILPFL